MPASKIAFGVVFFVVASALAKDKGIDEQIASVQSDKLKVEHQQKRAQFQGNVRVQYLGLTLHCDQMDVTYDDKGDIVSLRAQGKVTVTRGDTQATSKTARLDAPLNRLILDGNPVLVQGAHRLEGKRISVHLKNGRLEVVQAKGTFKFNLKGQP